jgi:predicted small secreted protein
MRRLLTLTALIGLLAAAAGCNTAEGFGQDLENAGEAITEEADEAEF